MRGVRVIGCKAAHKFTFLQSMRLLSPISGLCPSFPAPVAQSAKLQRIRSLEAVAATDLQLLVGPDPEGSVPTEPG